MDSSYNPALVQSAYAGNFKRVNTDLIRFGDGTQMTTAPVIPPTPPIGYYMYNGSAASDITILGGAVDRLGGVGAAGFGVVNAIQLQSWYSNDGPFLSFNGNTGEFTIGSGIFRLVIQMSMQSTTADPPSVVVTLNYNNGADIESREANLYPQKGGASTVHQTDLVMLGIYDTRATSGGTFYIKIDNTHLPNHDVTIYRPTVNQLKFVVERIL